MKTKIQSPLEARHSLVEPGTSSAAEMEILLDDIRVSIGAARRQEHEAAQNAGFKPLLAESSESTRLKAKISGLWNQDFAESAENKISLAEACSGNARKNNTPKLIN